MPNVGSVLRDEIVRLCRRELKKQTAALQRASAAARHDIAALKRQQAELERATKGLAKRSNYASVPAPAAAGDADFRFRADGFRTLRQRLGLSAEDMGTLLGVSGQSVYAWEQKRTTPRRAQLPAIAAVRRLGKREALQRLEAQRGA